MEIQQGYSYHIKDEFFDLVQDKYLMSNKEQANYRPHYSAIQDRKIQNCIGRYQLAHKLRNTRKSLKRKRNDMVNAIR